MHAVPTPLPSPGSQECAQVAAVGVGTQLGSYRLDRELARGGTGTVYEAHHVRLGRRAAVKVPLENDGDDPAVHDLFRNEARLLSLMDHPNVVRVLDASDDGPVPFIVLEYLKGETVAERLARNGAMVPREAIRIVSEIAAALEEVHACGVVHCDLKPANVFLVRARHGDDYVKLLDFGMSMNIERSADDDEVPPSSPRGTPSYMAPEQIDGSAELDHRADQFSLAVMAYELLSGKKAFCTGSVRSLLSLARARLPRLSEIAPWVCSECDAVLARATSPRPEDRYENIRAFADALRAALDDAPASVELRSSVVAAPMSVPPPSGVRSAGARFEHCEPTAGCSLCA